MRNTCVWMLSSVVAFVTVWPAHASMVAGGGSRRTDCATVFDIPGANKPALPRTPKAIDCIDGDATCDSDGLRNGECVFPVQVCINSTTIEGCTPDMADDVTVEHSADNGDKRFDTDFQAVQSRVNALGLPSGSNDACTLSTAITVKLVGPDSLNVMKKNKKNLRVVTYGSTAEGVVRDNDRVKLMCRPEGNAVYLPIDLYTGTFDRINKQVFAQSCALSGCHDSETHSGQLVLLSGSAYANLVGVTPDNSAAAADMLDRVTPGDENASFLYLKITGDLPGGYGDRMPFARPALDPEIIELIRLWIVGDGMTGPAPETGWVQGTDQ